jgi:hypothetical protein
MGGPDDNGDEIWQYGFLDFAAAFVTNTCSTILASFPTN